MERYFTYPVAAIVILFAIEMIVFQLIEDAPAIQAWACS